MVVIISCILCLFLFLLCLRLSNSHPWLSLCCLPITLPLCARFRINLFQTAANIWYATSVAVFALLPYHYVAFIYKHIAMICLLIFLSCTSCLWNHLHNHHGTFYRRAIHLSQIAAQESKELEYQRMEERALTNRREQVCQLNSMLFGSRLGIVCLWLNYYLGYRMDSNIR